MRTEGPGLSRTRTLIPQQRIDPEESTEHLPRVFELEPDFSQDWRPEGQSSGKPVSLPACPAGTAYRFATVDERTYETAQATIHGRGVFMPSHFAAGRAQAVAAGALRPDSTLYEYISGVSQQPSAPERTARGMVRSGALAAGEVPLERRRMRRDASSLMLRREVRSMPSVPEEALLRGCAPLTESFMARRNPAMMVGIRARRRGVRSMPSVSEDVLLGDWVRERDMLREAFVRSGAQSSEGVRVLREPRMRRLAVDMGSRLAPGEEPTMSGALPPPSQRSLRKSVSWAPSTVVPSSSAGASLRRFNEEMRYPTPSLYSRASTAQPSSRHAASQSSLRSAASVAPSTIAPSVRRAASRRSSRDGPSVAPSTVAPSSVGIPLQVNREHARYATPSNAPSSVKSFVTAPSTADETSSRCSFRAESLGPKDSPRVTDEEGAPKIDTEVSNTPSREDLALAEPLDASELSSRVGALPAERLAQPGEPALAPAQMEGDIADSASRKSLSVRSAVSLAKRKLTAGAGLTFRKMEQKIWGGQKQSKRKGGGDEESQWSY